MRARGTAWGTLIAIVATCALGAGSAAGAIGLPPTIGPEGCDDLTQSNADFEAYGPTDVNAQAGNGRVTVNVNAAGTITVFKYPNPSLHNLVKYFALRRDAQGRVHIQFPNEGSFAGIRYVTASGTHFAWLRQWPSSQRYDSPDTPVPVTTYRSPGGLGLTVTNIDLAPPGASSLEREYWVSRAPGSPVRSASLVYFGNFNPTATHIPLLPIADWCTAATSDGHAAYAPGSHAIVTSWRGIDVATVRPASMAVAFGFSGPDSAHQVGGDAYEPLALTGGPPDAYNQAPHGLGGSNEANGQTTAALEQPLRFDSRGDAEARMTIAGGADSAKALANLAAGRREGFARQVAAVGRDWRGFLSRTRLPNGGGQRVVDVAKRSLISLRLARVASTGAIVASANNQGPYGEDWIRDGAFLNRALDQNGFTGLVTRHNLFYARIQASPSHPSLIRPNGNWSMASYYDGIDGAPIPWEIDETGLGAWTLWDHHHFLRGAAARSYLQRVYPAIVRAADFMTSCEDPNSGMQCLANEDDNFTPSQSLHGAEAVDLGLRSAIAAADAMGDHSARVAAWKARRARLAGAINSLYNPAHHSYTVGGAGNAYNLDYGDGGWLLWPVRFLPYSDPHMTGEANAVYTSMHQSLAADRGQYEAKALLGLAHAWKPFSPRHRRQLERTLRYMARSLTTSTGLFGESWTRLENGRPIPVQDQPHVWEHTLFYLAALKIEGGAPYRFQRGDFVSRACARGAAPRSACTH